MAYENNISKLLSLWLFQDYWLKWPTEKTSVEES